MAIRQRLPLNQGWQFKQADAPDADYLNVQGFPTEIHRDLLYHGLIRDPFIGQQETQTQWVGERTWKYRTTFPIPANASSHIDIVFEGLDTYATVCLNGKEILRTDNMFVPERVNLDGKLLSSEDNVLDITFDSAFLKGKHFIEDHTDHHWGCWNGDPSRTAVRKAQYHYGWDWGPTLLCCGPWKPIYLETYESRIIDLHVTAEVDESLRSATIVARAEATGGCQVDFALSSGGKVLCTESVSVTGGTSAEVILKTKNPKLWFPRRYGEQPLHALSATLRTGEVILDTDQKRFGLRRAELIQRKLEDAPGTTFLFEINNVPIFCGGSNWIPAHSFLTALTPEDYRNWIRLLVDGNQSMLRIWGGGIYEHDSLYDACDELGILVWQDFMFACGNYPAHDEFLDTLKREAIANVKRLRHHPCIVIWAGNNEDYQYRETENLEYDPNDMDPASWLETTFPARYIYEKLLLDVMKNLCPDTFYHFGSPYGGEATSDPTVSDCHIWDVWHGLQRKYQDYDQLSARFVSEFGMEAYPNIETMDGFLPKGAGDVDRYAQSSTVEFHNKAQGHERRLAVYLAENINYNLEPLEQYIHCTQVVQAEAVATAYRLWKRQWKGPGREYCAGALVWQLNGCWPAIDWSIVDHYLRPKLAYYAVKRELESITVAMKRTVRTVPANKYTRVDIRTIHEIEVWACNLSLEELTVDLEFNTNTLVTEQKATDTEVTVRKQFIGTISRKQLPPNRSTELHKFEIPVLETDSGEEAQTIIEARMYDALSGTFITRAINWSEPLKHVYLSRPKDLSLSLSPLQDQNSTKAPNWWKPTMKASVLEIRTDMPLKAVKIEAQSDETVSFEDQGFDLMAETATYKVWGLGPGDEKKLSLRYLGM